MSTRKIKSTRAKAKAKAKPRTPKIDLSTEAFVGTKLYKVLQNNYGGERWSGGYSSFDWSPYLPKDGKPGKPCVISTNLSLSPCSYGLHVTNRPIHWGASSTPYKYVRIFAVKVFGPTKGSLKTDNKICAYKVQLIREVVNPARVGDVNEWAKITNSTYTG